MNNSLMAVSPKITISKQSSKDTNAASKKPQNVTQATTEKENSKPIAVAA